MLSLYSRLCFSKLDNAVHGPRYASFTSEYPRRNLAPPFINSLAFVVRAQQLGAQAAFHQQSSIRRSRPTTRGAGSLTYCITFSLRNAVQQPRMRTLAGLACRLFS